MFGYYDAFAILVSIRPQELATPFEKNQKDWYLMVLSLFHGTSHEEGRHQIFEVLVRQVKNA